MSNPLIEALYGDDQDTGLEKIAGPEAVAVLDELIKTAAAEGQNLADFSDDDIAEMVLAVMVGDDGAEDGYEKVASAPGAAPGLTEDHVLAAIEHLEKTAEAQGMDINAFSDDAIADAALQLIFADDGVEKVASADALTVADVSEEDFEKLANAHANDILSALGQLDDESTEAVEGRVKVASVPMDDQLADLVGERAAELLAENGWDVQQIAGILSEIAEA